MEGWKSEMITMEVKNSEDNTMEENKAENEVKTVKRSKKEEVKKMNGKKEECKEETKVTEKQKAQFKKCLDFFGRSAKAWVEVAEHYNKLSNLPEALWRSDEVLQGERKPTVGKFLKKKFDLSESRLSQYAGAYKARKQLEGVDGYDKISCDALYEIFRFANGNDNKGMTVKDVYEAVRAAEGAVSEKTVKDWRKQFKPNVNNAVKQKENVFERLSKLIDDAQKASLEEATEGLIEALQVKWNAFMDRIRKASNEQNDLECEDDNMEATAENGGKEMMEEKETACVA